MTSPTDTNQASEELINAFIEKWAGDHAAHLLDNDDNDGERLRQAIEDLIRTEKLKLLDRLSSHQEDLFWWTGGEYDKLEGIDMRAIAAERELLTKLEAEL